MADSNLVDSARGLYKKFTDTVGRIPTPGYKPKRQEADPDKVRAANEGFRKKAAEDRAAKPAKSAKRKAKRSTRR